MNKWIEHKHEPHIPYPGAKCQWCGDTGTFLDIEDNEWTCFEDCPRDKEEEPA